MGIKDGYQRWVSKMGIKDGYQKWVSKWYLCALGKWYTVLLYKELYLDLFQRDRNTSNVRWGKHNNPNTNYEWGDCATTKVSSEMRKGERGYQF